MKRTRTIASPGYARTRSTAKAVRRSKERGIALVTVLIAIAITLVMTNEFGTSTNSDMIAAANYRDEMRAHFLARSATNLAELVIQVQMQVDKARKQIGPIQITDYADMMILPFCGDKEQVQDAIGISTEQVPGLGADIGTCGFNGPFETEDNKINLNCANVPGGTATMIKTALDALLYFQAYDPIFEESDAEGWRRDRATQVTAIIDYIDRDSTRGVAANQAGAAEDYGYESLKDRYEAKNNYIDTLGELKQARGVDDRFWNVFGDAFTVYGDCKINLGAVTNPQLIAAVLMLSAKNQNDPTLMDPRRLFILAGVVAKAKQMGESFTDAKEFIAFVKDPQASLLALASTGGMAGSAAGAAVSGGIPGVPPGEKVGMELDEKLLNQIVTFEARRTYRVEAYGEIERKQKNADGSPVFPAIRKTITGVWNTKVVPSNVRKLQTFKGAWQFLRED